MDMVAPLGPVYQAGTLSGNPVAMAAGLATLRHLDENRGVYAQLEKMAEMLARGVAEAASAAEVQLRCNRVGSMFTWFFKAQNVWDWASAESSDTAAFGKFHRGMLENGVYLPPSQFEAAFLSAAHTEEDVRATVDAAKAVFKSF